MAFLVLIGCGLAALKVIYGGGDPYPDVSTMPLIDAESVEVLVELDFPPACVAVSSDGRLFFDLHTFGHPKRFGEDVLFELRDGTPVPYPDAASQRELRAPFGLTVGPGDRLWVIESGGLEGFRTRVLAFDLATGARVADHRLPKGVGRFAQDLRVTPDGRHLVLADTGLFRFTDPSLLVVDAANGDVVRTFSGHPSLEPQDWFIRRWDGTPFRLAWGLISFQVGVDGLTISDDGVWLYYATMSHDGLYRVSLDRLRDPDADHDAVSATIERVATKPLSDGIEHVNGTTYITDIENGGIATVDDSGTLRTLVSLSDVIWADGVTVTPEGAVVFTDSAIPAYGQPLASPPPLEVLARSRPYRLYRVDLSPAAPDPAPDEDRGVGTGTE
jgi:sugar lactone lactonase YvrE